MNLKPSRIRVESLLWNYDEGRNVDRIAAHFITPADVQAVLANGPLFFRNAPGKTASHVMVGRDSRGRALWVTLMRTGRTGEWYPITATEHRVVRRYLEGLGR